MAMRAGSKSRPSKRRPAHGRSTGRRRAPTQSASKPQGDSPDGERLQKVLAAAGVASRRECELLITEGRIEVDRQVVTELGVRVDAANQEIRVDGEPLHQPKLVYFAVHKPTGYVATARDPAGRSRVTDLLPPNTPRTFCVGRLDMASEGLILVTNDGELANGLTHPRHGVEKTYHVQVAGRVEHDVLRKLHQGVHLAEGFAHAKHVTIKRRRKQSTVLEMVLDEGRNREVRRLLARLGHKVQKLVRVAVGPVRLGEMPAGAVRTLTRQEIQGLKRAVTQGSQPPQAEESRPAKPSRRRRPNRK